MLTTPAGSSASTAWGIISCGMAFVTGPTSFYVMRLLLGAAEAGLYPGIIYYLTLWFGREERAKATGLFLLGYGVCRAALENVRQPDAGLEHLPLGLTMGMILSTPMMLVGVWLIWRALKKPVVTEA